MVIRLVPMSEREFESSLERAVPRHAAECVRRGLWTESAAVEASRLEFAQLLPQGIRTPHRHFCTAIDAASGAPVGETWYFVQEKGGKTQFWIDWIWIDPRHRRQGHASRVLEHLAEIARVRGADRIGLSVVSDNPGAIALYAKLGYEPFRTQLVKLLTPTPSG
ncbi:MAG: GNAT family N-acetyltransferase [Thermoplasmata archaeon]|nr:GNAT family N-acetyltransferase [Thermoplasmata archaeon]